MVEAKLPEMNLIGAKCCCSCDWLTVNDKTEMPYCAVTVTSFAMVEATKFYICSEFKEVKGRIYDKPRKTT